MNYILISDYEENWREAIKNIFNDNFLKEVNYDSEDRVDCVFGEFTIELQNEEYNNPTGRDRVDKIKEFFSTRGGGAVFSILEIRDFQNLLYTEEDIQSLLSQFYSESDYQFEIRSVCLQEFGLNSTNFKYFLILYKSEYPKLIFKDPKYLSFKKNLIDEDKPIENDLPIKLLEYVLQHLRNYIEDKQDDRRNDNKYIK